eukprot:249421-Pyramimonas_sp.AAC.1
MSARGWPGSVASRVGGVDADAGAPAGARAPSVRSLAGGADAGSPAGAGARSVWSLAGGVDAGMPTGARARR